VTVNLGNPVASLKTISPDVIASVKLTNSVELIDFCAFAGIESKFKRLSPADASMVNLLSNPDCFAVKTNLEKC
jgi:hypothetical protein